METELKVRVPEFGPVRERLRQTGATGGNVVDEDNRYFDRGDEIRRGGQSLRLRRDEPVASAEAGGTRGEGRVRMTWKGPLAFADGVRSRPELEVVVSDFATTAEILAQLGFRETARLRKRRETWHLPGVEVTLDELRFGRFVELEGEDATIRDAARRLGLDPDRGLKRSYLQLAGESGENPAGEEAPAG